MNRSSTVVLIDKMVFTCLVPPVFKNGLSMCITVGYAASPVDVRSILLKIKLVFNERSGNK